MNNFPTISYYAGKIGSSEINNALRSGRTTSKEIQCKIDSLEQELSKMPKGNNTTVYRYDSITNWHEHAIFYKYMIGKVIQRPEFLSVSFKKPIPFHLIIKTAQKSNCNDLRPSFQLENEKDNSDKIRIESHGIFQRNTNFKVIDVDDENELIYLEETNLKEDFILFENAIYNHPYMADKIKIREYPESLSELGLI